MINKILQTLFGRKAKSESEDLLARAQSEIQQLRTVVFELHVEVEAIRETLLKSPLGSGGSSSVYAQSYYETALLTHNAMGPSGGYEKLARLFYEGDSKSIESICYAHGDDWRECLFMKRLGFPPKQISEYRREAEGAEILT
jgi:hypothetical protein